MRIPGSVVSLPSPTAPPHPQSQSRPGPDAFPQLRPQPPTCPAPGPPAEEVSASPPARKKGERMRVKASRRGVPYQLPQGPRLLPGQTLNFLSLKNGGEPLPRSLKLGTSRFSMGGRRQDARKWHQGPRRPLPAPAPPRTRLTHPKVLMKPLTEPSAYRETMSPMWRKLDISLMTAARRGPGAVRAPRGARPGSVQRTEMTAEAGGARPHPRAGRSARPGRASGHRGGRRRGAAREPLVASG